MVALTRSRSRRLWMPETYIEALPMGRTRGGLVHLLNALLARALRDRELYDDRILCDAPRKELAEHCGVSVRTIRRYEDELEACGVVRKVVANARRRVLEILEPGAIDPAKHADRASERSKAEAAAPSKVDSGDHLRWTPVTTSERPVLTSEREEGESRGAREEAPASQCPIGQPDQVDLDLAITTAKAILGHVEDQLRIGFEQRGGEAGAWRLGRNQRRRLEGSIAGRVSALRRSGAGSLATTLTRRDVDRVLGMAAKASRPAAYLTAAIVGGDWRSDPAPGSAAQAVREAGHQAEMPVRDRGARSGPHPSLGGPLATPADLARLERALEAARASDEQRRAVRRLTRSEQVQEFCARLEAAIVRRQHERGGVA